MLDATVAPYGSWRSPITSDLIVADAIRFGMIALDGQDIYWIEGRPAEKGRNVIVRHSSDGSLADMTPAGFNVRTRAQEYGGGDFTVYDGTLYFVNDDDQRIYRQVPGTDPEPMSPASYAKQARFADLVVDAKRRRLLCVCEDHSKVEREPVTVLVSLPLDGDGEEGIQILLAGNSFYTTPCLSPDGNSLAWITWNHPQMPWDGTELWVAELDDHGFISSAQMIAGGPDESIFQPAWSPDGVLYFVSDRTNWWNIYRWRDNGREAVCPKDAEFGVPQWTFGMSTYGFLSAEQIFCTYNEFDGSRIALLNVNTGTLDVIQSDYTSIGGSVKVNAEHAVFLAASPINDGAIVRFDSETKHLEILRGVQGSKFDPAYISQAQLIEFPTEQHVTAYGYYYAPKNALFTAPSDELPPLLVLSHGGPTGSTSNALNMKIQFWTSRGFAVLDVNYGGSTGYGRAYRQRLNGQWGIVDVDDCTNGARYLVQKGLVDGNRLTIQGGSAGGYTTLCALTFKDEFKAGASYYGISDLERLEQDTHKFESHYNHILVGPYPERRDLYYDRSPINFTEQLSCPIIFFQGLEDKVVPPNQAEMMVDALRRKHLPVAYVPFEGEGHGFRRSENIKRALEAQLYFFARVFNFKPADDIEPVEIMNM